MPHAGGILGRMRRRVRAVVLVLVVVVLTGCSVISLDLTPRVRPLEEKTVEGHGRDKILLMEVSGFISDDASPSGLSLTAAPPRVPLLVRVREELEKASKDDKIKAVVLRLNSPGGTVTASDIIFRELQLFRTRNSVPIVAVMMDVAASGAYYIALAADTIVAHPTTVTGSIGVIMVSANVEGLMQKIGLAANTIKSGEHKDMGSPFRPLTPEERGIFQSIIDDLQRQFVSKVAERRKLPLETARSLADGRVYTAEQALASRLVDRVGYLPDAIDVAKRAAGLDDARIVIYRRPHQYRVTYYAQAESPSSGLDASLGGIAALSGFGPRFLYLWLP
jgi:protease IV